MIDLPKADHVTTSVCQHGTLTVVLYDKAHRPFAEFHMPAENAAVFVSSITEGLTGALMGDTIGECAGHA